MYHDELDGTGQNAHWQIDEFMAAPTIHTVGAVGEPAFENSWVNYGGGYATAGFYRDVLGVVHLKGLLKSGTGANAMFTLPVGYRPPALHMQATVSNDAFAVVYVGTTGAVYRPIGSGDGVSLDGISFYVG